MRVFSRLLKVFGPLLLLMLPAGADNDHPFIQDLKSIKTVAVTVPGNGDQNPYGVSIVPVTTGALEEQSVLVSNFNNSGNLQGTGTTIDEVSPNGNVKVFATLNAH